VISLSAGIEAIRAGIMKGTLLDGFPEPRAPTEALGELSVNVFLSTGDLRRPRAAAEPIPLSLRFSDSTQFGVDRVRHATGGRRGADVYFMPSADRCPIDHLRLDRRFSSVPKGVVHQVAVIA
jgi:hypothetical protein